MKKNCLLVILATCGFLGFASQANAQILISYAIGNDTGGISSPTPTITSTATTTATNLTLGAGLAPDSNSFYPGFQARGTLTNNGFSSTLAGAESTDAYYTFTIAPTSGNELTITSLDFTNTALFSSDSASTFALESSVTGFGSSTTIASFSSSSTVNSSPTTVGDFTLGSNFQNLTSPVEFRLYVYGSGIYNTVSMWNPATTYPYTNSTSAGPFVIDGTVTSAVPEPGSFALLGLGLALLGLIRHQRRSALV